MSQDAAESDRVDHIARAGLIVYGILHLLVAWLVLRLAAGDKSGSASGSGAMHILAQSAVGRFTLYALAAGFAALATWHGVEAVLGYHRFGFVEKLSNRLVSAVKVLVFAAIGVNTLLLATGSSSTSRSPDGYTARLMSLPAGALLVGLVGAVIVVVGLVLVYFGLARNFRETMSHQGQTGQLGKAYLLLGVMGYVSRGIAITLVGGLFIYAAITHDPQKSGGLDQALQDVVTKPFGAPILALMALGLACFGLFCFAWARHIDR